MQILLGHPQWSTTDLRSLRLIGTGSSTVPEALIRGFSARGLSVVQVYGATETGPISVYLTATYADTKIGSAGKPALYCEARIVDASGIDVPDETPGEIWLRGPAVSPGYWGETPRLPHDWFATGDVGHRDQDGFYYIDDRIKDMVISGGENIYPAEVENALYDHPAVAEVAVIGVPHPRWVEIPIARCRFTHANGGRRPRSPIAVRNWPTSKRLGLCSLSRVYLATQWAKCRNSNFEKSSQRSN